MNLEKANMYKEREGIGISREMWKSFVELVVW